MIDWVVALYIAGSVPVPDKGYLSVTYKNPAVVLAPIRCNA
jgi:hypothetical protein